MISAIVSVLLLVGVSLSIVTAFGIHRLKDPYTRLHATATVNSLGLICIMLASALYFSGKSASHSFRQLLTILFIFVTVPAGTHILSRAALVRDVKVWKVSGELSEAEEEIIQTLKKQSEARRALRERKRDGGEGVAAGDP